MAWPEEIEQTVGSTWYLQWQSEAEMNFKSRNTEDFKWFLWFLIRSSIYGFVLYHVFRFLKRKVPRLLGYGPFRRDPNVRKFWRVVCNFSFSLCFSFQHSQFVVSSSIVASVTPFMFVDHSDFLHLQLITKIGFIYFAEIIFYL